MGFIELMISCIIRYSDIFVYGGTDWTASLDRINGELEWGVAAEEARVVES